MSVGLEKGQSISFRSVLACPDMKHQSRSGGHLLGVVTLRQVSVKSAKAFSFQSAAFLAKGQPYG
jgi:hypothetical protein